MREMKSKKCIRCKNPYEANPIIKGDNCCRSCDRLNDITYWYPVLFRNGIPVPKTVIIHTNLELLAFLDNKEVIGIDGFITEIITAIENVGSPAFLRTGHTSNKHDWKHSCFIKKDSDIQAHVFNLMEFSCMMTIDRVTPYDYWAVREFIKTEPYFSYFDGEMPITKERRYFVRNGKIECRHSYWPKEIFKETDKNIIEELNSITKEDKEILDSMAIYISQKFSGYWSIDFLKGKTGKWYCTDMAIGEMSFHQEH